MTIRFASRETRRLPRGGGFSLIELVAVMVVAGILAGVAVVSLSSTRSSRTTIAARQLERDLTFARQRAVATGVRCWVSFDTGANTWSVLSEDSASPGRDPGATVLTDPSTHGPFVHNLNANQFIGVTLGTVDFDGEDWIGFDWLGQPLAKTSELALVAQGFAQLTGGGVTRTVTVEVGTGHVAYTP